MLELLEVRAGLELRVGLRHGEQAAEPLGDLGLGLLPVRGGGACGLDGVGAGGGDGLEDRLLVGGVPLHRRDQVGDQVVPALQLDVDVTPRVGDQLPLGDEPVVGDDHVAHQSDEDADARSDRDHETPCLSCSGRPP